jgi:hypothetical protein
MKSVITELGFVGDDAHENIVKIIEEVEEEDNVRESDSSHKDFDFEKSQQ